MCGLNGVFAYHSAAGAIDERELLRTRDAMIARGPDGAGEWWDTSRRCAFGHRRLSIIDLSDRASQPMKSADGQLVIVFNGEIYNYPSLRSELERSGVHFRTRSDTEVLLHLYERDGAEMVRQLRGMFAFVIWDGRKRGLFLARDPYGMKPLYTSDDGWTFRFASQVKALMAGGRMSRDLEPAGVVGFYLFGSVPEPFTLYGSVRSLPSGHTQWVDSAGPRQPKPFFNMASVLAQGAQRQASQREISEYVRWDVLDSVRAHLMADVEVGIFLSAGIDSGALLGLMRDAGQRDIRAVTLAFDEFRGTAEDEAPLAAHVAERYGATHVVRRVTEREFQDDLPTLLDAMDQPSIDGVNTWFVAKAAKEAGLKVAISGLGGDELLAGYPSFETMPRWRRRFGAVASVPGLGRVARRLIRSAAPSLRRARPKALGLLEYAGTWPGLYLLQRGVFLPRELDEFLDNDLVHEGMRRLQPERALAASLVPDPGSDTGRICILESAHYMRHQLLRDADWAGMAHSVEIRMPLVDTTLLKSMAPVISGLRPGDGKAALAQAPSLPLPHEIITRDKTGFVVPTGTWIAKATGRRSAPPFGTEHKGLVSRRWLRTVIAAH